MGLAALARVRLIGPLHNVLRSSAHWWGAEPHDCIQGAGGCQRIRPRAHLVTGSVAPFAYAPLADLKSPEFVDTVENPGTVAGVPVDKYICRVAALSPALIESGLF